MRRFVRWKEEMSFRMDCVVRFSFMAPIYRTTVLFVKKKMLPGSGKPWFWKVFDAKNDALVKGDYAVCCHSVLDTESSIVM
jgi:hypothetical protein